MVLCGFRMFFCTHCHNFTGNSPELRRGLAVRAPMAGWGLASRARPADVAAYSFDATANDNTHTSIKYDTNHTSHNANTAYCC